MEEGHQWPGKSRGWGTQGNGAPKGELMGQGSTWLYNGLSSLYIYRYTSHTPYLRVPGAPIYFISQTFNKNLATGLYAVVYYPETSQRLTTTDHFIFWSPNLQSRKGLFKENSFLMMRLLFSSLQFSDLILKCNRVTQWIIKFQLYLNVYIGPQAYEILHTHIWHT